MSKNHTPLQSSSVPEQPTSVQLIKSTLIALGLAIAILVAIVLPAEYAIDPTGIGRILGLTEMGKIKNQLSKEAAIESMKDKATLAATPITDPEASKQNIVSTDWRDTMQVTLKPGDGVEVKLTMKSGEQAEFNWTAKGGLVNYDTHGEGLVKGQFVSYEKGRNASAKTGTIEAVFDGHHGWFWRNRSQSEVEIVVQARGQYAEMQRVM